MYGEAGLPLEVPVRPLHPREARSGRSARRPASSLPSLRVASVLYPPTSSAVGGGASHTLPDAVTSPGQGPAQRGTVLPGLGTSCRSGQATSAGPALGSQYCFDSQMWTLLSPLLVLCL